MRTSERAAVTELFVFDTAMEKTKLSAIEARDFYSLSYRYCGNVLFRTQNVELISEAGSVTFMPRNTPYKTEIQEDMRMTAVHFKLNRDIEFRNPSVLQIHDKSIQRLFERLAQRFRVDEPLDFGCMAIFYELLAKLESLASEDPIPHKIALARELMLQNFSDPLFSITALAERLEISTSYLRREFAKSYGKKPIAFLRELRIGRARNLLQSEYLSIAQIAAQSGFSSVSYFIQVFHKAEGESPERYRRRFYT